LTNHIAEQAEPSLDLIFAMCVFQERLLLTNSPRNFVSTAVRICLSSYVIGMSEVHVLLLVNWVIQVLSEFKESKLALTHLFSCPKTILRSL